MGLLEEKICLITGASRGIGLATARKFAGEGAVVYTNVRSTENCGESYAALITEYPDRVRQMVFDVCDQAAAKAAIMQIKKESGRLDVLVNNAGVMRDALIGMVTDSLMEEIFEVNVFAVINMLQLAVKLMSRQKSGSIINLSSIVGLEGSSGQMVYSASKGAVMALTKSAAKELAPRGIRVNAVAPGMIDTDLFRSIGEDKMKEQVGHIRMGRFGTPEDVAGTITYLASDLAEYVTGEIIGVNGSAMM